MGVLEKFLPNIKQKRAMTYIIALSISLRFCEWFYTTCTKVLLSRPFLKRTVPSLNANKV